LNVGRLIIRRGVAGVAKMIQELLAEVEFQSGKPVIGERSDRGECRSEPSILFGVETVVPVRAPARSGISCLWGLTLAPPALPAHARRTIFGTFLGKDGT
jgi:hypothetical protein